MTLLSRSERLVAFAELLRGRARWFRTNDERAIVDRGLVMAVVRAAGPTLVGIAVIPALAIPVRLAT